jgi:hypothetical protein
VIETTSFRPDAAGSTGDPGGGPERILGLVVAYFLMYEITAHGGFVGSGLGMSTKVGGIVVLTWLAGRVYANAALRLGTRVSFRDAFRG